MLTQAPQAATKNTQRYEHMLVARRHDSTAELITIVVKLLGSVGHGRRPDHRDVCLFQLPTRTYPPCKPRKQTTTTTMIIR
eukprot:scaffold8428_cov151-Skeletonema_menzelii.AAC.13